MENRSSRGARDLLVAEVGVSSVSEEQSVEIRNCICVCTCSNLSLLLIFVQTCDLEGVQHNCNGSRREEEA